MGVDQIITDKGELIYQEEREGGGEGGKEGGREREGIQKSKKERDKVMYIYMYMNTCTVGYNNYFKIPKIWL